LPITIAISATLEVQHGGLIYHFRIARPETSISTEKEVSEQQPKFHKNKLLKMSIRAAVPVDYPRMAEVAAAAFMEDDVYGRFMFPHRRQYPEDYITQWERRIAMYATKPEYEQYVAVDALTGSVVAWACWERIGPGAAARANPLYLRKFAGTTHRRVYRVLIV
jgi:hypothetical protein